MRCKDFSDFITILSSNSLMQVIKIMENQIVWVDIAVRDLARAVKFYSAILGNEVTIEEACGCQFGLLPHAKTNVAGCLFVDESGEHISDKGPLVYLNCDNRIDDAIAKVGEFGGKILEEKMSLGEHGARAVILDSEGNRMALHSNESVK